MKKSVMLAVGLLFAGISSSAMALPFSVSDASGLRGQNVAVTLNDLGTQGFDGLTFTLHFDTSVLDFVDFATSDLSVGGDASGFEDTPGNMIGVLSVNPVADGSSGGLVQALFHIRNDAAFGPTDVSFVCADFGTGVCVDYALPLTTGQVTVLPDGGTGNSVPEPASLSLALAGLAGAAAVRRRKR